MLSLIFYTWLLLLFIKWSFRFRFLGVPSRDCGVWTLSHIVPSPDDSKVTDPETMTALWRTFLHIYNAQFVYDATWTTGFNILPLIWQERERKKKREVNSRHSRTVKFTPTQEWWMMHVIINWISTGKVPETLCKVRCCRCCAVCKHWHRLWKWRDATEKKPQEEELQQ